MKNKIVINIKAYGLDLIFSISDEAEFNDVMHIIKCQLAAIGYSVNLDDDE